jgi:minor extracellular serine protease Vpr
VAGTAGLAVSQSGKIYFPYNNQVWALAPSNGVPLTFSPNGVANAAGLTPGPVTPGSIATLYGDFSLEAPAAAITTPLPTVLSGFSMQAGSANPISVPLYYVSSEAVNIQVPWELTGQSSATFQASLNGAGGGSQIVPLVPFSPGIFTIGANQGAVVDLLGRLVDATNPVMAGSVIAIYCSGLGAVSNPPATGSPASTAITSETMTTPVVTIGGVPAPVLFSGLAPGSVGEYQVNVQVPAGSGTGSAVPVVLSIGGALSNAVTIGVR